MITRSCWLEGIALCSREKMRSEYWYCDCQRAVIAHRFIAAACEAVRLNSTVLLELQLCAYCIKVIEEQKRMRSE